MTPGRWALVVWVFVVAAMTVVAVTVAFGPWRDSRLPADQAAKQLRGELGVAWTFECTWSENDGSLPADVDYLCMPIETDDVGYWIETDETGITIVTATG